MSDLCFSYHQVRAQESATVGLQPTLDATDTESNDSVGTTDYASTSIRSSAGAYAEATTTQATEPSGRDAAGEWATAPVDSKTQAFVSLMKVDLKRLSALNPKSLKSLDKVSLIGGSWSTGLVYMSLDLKGKLPGRIHDATALAKVQLHLASVNAHSIHRLQVSAYFLAEISVRSPPKLFILTI